MNPEGEEEEEEEEVDDGNEYHEVQNSAILQERIEQLEQSLEEVQRQAQDLKAQKELNQRIIISLEK